ncbi:phosphoribosylamine--glycine ligase [Altererythrobacter aurantiacus]|uniref:Phosphoribosylamine--glycine ligase n=1 Tax=Parapontixanthobacter aurantiacus TaxID=1463599 RepID=A0A844ZI23_9SPHN|nr:phosphoribosylamine--glycine ligase [Parapontixanthobacter aurantiacus]MXO86902.1 phosphoribosylamine--glycine ligase [Parapontixanthobacter aurantiacus]
MNILLIGSGGREHALCWKLMQSSLLAGDGDTLFASPGNPGMAEEGARCVPLDTADHGAVVQFCRDNKVEFVVIGPEAPLVDGLADSLRTANMAVFGPSADAAQLEGSKSFTKELCDRASIPTARYIRTSSLEQAWGALKQFDPPFVLKADGLAAGKGVIIAETREEAQEALAEMFDGKFGSAGAEVVIEEYLEGEEVSYFALTDGNDIVFLASAQDHKRVGGGDTGPNTGGMGAYSPAPVLTKSLENKVMDEIIRPTVTTMAAEGRPYSGVLFAGLMLTEKGPQLIEYNARFGDPECQAILSRMTSDLGELLHACATGSLGKTAPELAQDTVITVVLAANGYPGTPEKGGTISGLKDAENIHTGTKIFHAGTKRGDDGGLVANGGRVLNVTARGADIGAARDKAYAAIDAIHFPTGFCRRDIGHRALARENAAE